MRFQRHRQGFRSLVCATLAIGFWQCGTQGPSSDEYLQLKLNDSLSLFDSVQIVLLNPSDSSKVLQEIWSAPLPNPSNMDTVKLLFPSSQAYLVRIRAWNEEGLLGWESFIIPDGDSSKTLRTVLPQLRPYLVELASISPSVGQLEPSFQAARTSYQISLGFLSDSLTLLAEAADPRASVKMRAGTSDLGSDSICIQPQAGNTEILITVTNKGDRNQTYHLLIVKPAVPTPHLLTLEPAAGSLTPPFSSERLNYELSVPYSASRISFSAFSADSFATVVVNGDTLRSGHSPNSIPAPVGESQIGIHLMAGSKTMDYAIHVIRADIDTADTTQHPPENHEPPRLLALEFAEGSLVPPFNDLTTQYEMHVDDTIAFAHMSSADCDSGVTMMFGGETLPCGDLPQPILLIQGRNTLDIVLVRDSTQAETTYTVTIFRKPKFTLESFAYSARIRVNTTANGANVLSRVTGFPMLLRLRSGTFPFAEARGDGADIRIARADGTLLPYEIERWDSANAQADIWLRADTISGNAVKDVGYLCWGNPDAASEAAPNKVFAPVDGFAAVWHMDSTFGDATGSGNIGASRGGAAAVSGSLVGYGLSTNGNNQGVAFGNKASLIALTSNIQVEGWVKTTQNSVLASIFRHDRHFSPLEILGNKSAQASLYIQARDTTRILDSLKTVPLEWTGKYDDSTWHQIVAQYESTTGLVVYWDGRVAATLTKVRGNLNTSSLPYMVGISESGSQSYQGLTDEVRVQSQVRSADWVKLNYEILRPDSKTVSIIH